LKPYVACILLLMPTALQAKPFLIITGAKSSLTNASEDDIQRLYLGRSTSVNNADVAPVDYDDANELSQDFREKILKKNSVQYRQYWARLLFTGRARPPVSSIKSEQEMIQYVQANENSIGYISNEALAKNVKVLLKLGL